jgi:hypothetical protein
LNIALLWIAEAFVTVSSLNQAPLDSVLRILALLLPIKLFKW